jgi:hypothetical protein
MKIIAWRERARTNDSEMVVRNSECDALHQSGMTTIV